MTTREKFLFIAWCREFWNMNMGNTQDRFIVWEHPQEHSI